MAPPTRRRTLVLAALLIAGGLAALVLVLAHRRPRTSLDPATALAAHNRGIGLMEQFDYRKAADAFAEAVRLDPDWLPGQVNLGIALLNTANDAGLDRA